MSMKKASIDVGFRAAEEVRSHFGTVYAAAKAIGVHFQTIYKWEEEGATPSAFCLVAMAENGVDIHYILTGKRGGK